MRKTLFRTWFILCILLSLSLIVNSLITAKEASSVSYKEMKSVEDKKARAAACHASQLGGRISNRGIMNWIARRTSGTESFMQAYPEPTGELRTNDLFAGLNVFWGCTG